MVLLEPVGLYSRKVNVIH